MSEKNSEAKVAPADVLKALKEIQENSGADQADVKPAKKAAKPSKKAKTAPVKTKKTAKKAVKKAVPKKAKKEPKPKPVKKMKVFTVVTNHKGTLVVKNGYNVLMSASAQSLGTKLAISLDGDGHVTVTAGKGWSVDVKNDEAEG